MIFPMLQQLYVLKHSCKLTYITFCVSTRFRMRAKRQKLAGVHGWKVGAKVDLVDQLTVGIFS